MLECLLLLPLAQCFFVGLACVLQVVLPED